MTQGPDLPLKLRVALWVVASLLCGCAGTPKGDPISAMTSRQRGAAAQIRAAELAAQTHPDDPRRLAALWTLVTDRGYLAQVRNVAIDQLAAYDESAFRARVARQITLIENPQTLEHLFEIAVQRRWTDFTPVLVHRWARPTWGVADDDRLEKRFLQQLNPDRDVQRVVFDVFTGPDDAVTNNQRVGAWELLNRLTDSETIIAYLDAAPQNSALVVDLRAASRELHALPRNREGILWLQYLRSPERREWWDRAAARVARLNDAQKRGLQLRHLPVLLALDDATLASDSHALLSQLHALLRDQQQHLKGPTYDGPMQDWPQTLKQAQAQLVWADLLTMRLLFDAVRDPSVAAALFREAAKDVQDTSTEYGGVLEIKDARPVAHFYRPLTRVNDFRYVPRPEMIEHMYTAVAHFHFHAQHVDNSMHAGPGLGDVRLADRLNPNGLVFTSIDKDRLNVDYYQPGGTVVDLGTLRR